MLTAKHLIGVLLLLSSGLAPAQAEVQYRLSYTAAEDSSVQIHIALPSPRPGPLTLIMPRNYPGGYDLVLYDRFVENVKAFSAAGKPLGVARATDGPRWMIGVTGDQIAGVEYSVDVARMEREILPAVETSELRPGYLGLLGYSVFAYFDGLEEEPVKLQADAPRGWPVLSTLAPTVPATLDTASASAPNYYALADSQVLMGPGLQLRQFPGNINLLLAVYAEGEEDLQTEGELARTALDDVQQYFGDTPFATYTVHLELLQPRPGHDYGFSQEHLNSGSFSFSVARAITARTTTQEKQVTLFNYAHHMAHSWIPKRAYGQGYAPFVWELPPLIETIWFNEGFGRYAAMEALAEGMPPQEAADFRRRQLAILQKILDEAPPFIRRMSLVELSREASFLYSVDFRIGMNTFARGALMAAEMDDRIRRETEGRRSLRDALRFLIARTQREQKPFQVDELPGWFQQATGVNVGDILQRWLKPPT